MHWVIPALCYLISAIYWRHMPAYADYMSLTCGVCGSGTHRRHDRLDPGRNGPDSRVHRHADGLRSRSYVRRRRPLSRLGAAFFARGVRHLSRRDALWILLLWVDRSRHGPGGQGRSLLSRRGPRRHLMAASWDHRWHHFVFAVFALDLLAPYRQTPSMERTIGSVLVEQTSCIDEIADERRS
jgi:hypothetical protein